MPDFGFVGPSYEAPNPDQDAQRTVNWYVEVSGNDSSKTPKTLLGTPGLLQVAALAVGECRGAWELPGGAQALWVSGNAVYLMTVSGAATGSAPATFSVKQVGSLLTSTGQVCIRDNNAGGIAVLVDGPYGYVYNIAAQTLTRITDPGFLGADRVTFIDGWFIFNRPGTQTFYTPPIYWDGIKPIDATYFALKDYSSDNLVSMVESLRELWLIGEKTTEVWIDTGGATFPFMRLQGVALQLGCAAKHSIARLNHGSLIWLARSERGQNVVVRTDGYAPSVCSNRAVEHAIASYPVVSDAIGYVYQEEGHEFYVLTFPTADVTWVYDATSNMWHQRASFDPAAGKFHRHRSNCYLNFQNQRLVGDYANGLVHAMSRAYYDDNGAPLIALRRAPHVWDGGERERLFHASLQVQFRTGNVPQSGQGSNPVALLRWSDDSGQTWSNEHAAPIGVAGATKNRVIWRRLGQSRDRIYEVSVSDPVPRDVVGATLGLA